MLENEEMAIRMNDETECGVRTMPPFCLSGPAAVCALVMLPFCTFAACWVINAASRVTGIPAVPGENVVLGIVVSSIIGAISVVSVWRWIVSGGKYVRVFASVVLALFGLAVLIAVETSEMGWKISQKWIIRSGCPQGEIHAVRKNA